MKQEKLYINQTCTSCDFCRLVCPEQVIFSKENEYQIDHWFCTLCEVCQIVCPVDAIKYTHEKKTA